jgi:hypothetical protein
MGVKEKENRYSSIPRLHLVNLSALAMRQTGLRPQRCFSTNSTAAVSSAHAIGISETVSDFSNSGFWLDHVNIYWRKRLGFYEDQPVLEAVIS